MVGFRFSCYDAKLKAIPKGKDHQVSDIATKHMWNAVGEPLKAGISRKKVDFRRLHSSNQPMFVMPRVIS